MKNTIKKIWHSGDGVEKWLFEEKVCGIPLYWIILASVIMSGLSVAISLISFLQTVSERSVA